MTFDEEGGSYSAVVGAAGQELATRMVNLSLEALISVIVGARKLISLGGWARHGIFYEFDSAEGHEHFFQLLEANANDASTVIGKTRNGQASISRPKPVS